MRVLKEAKWVGGSVVALVEEEPTVDGRKVQCGGYGGKVSRNEKSPILAEKTYSRIINGVRLATCNCSTLHLLNIQIEADMVSDGYDTVECPRSKPYVHPITAPRDFPTSMKFVGKFNKIFSPTVRDHQGSKDHWSISH